MSDYDLYHFSITIHTDDLAVVHCLRGLAQYSQATGNRAIPWGYTKETQWKAGRNTVTFRFTDPLYRDQFAAECGRLLPSGLWQEVARDDSDPARPARP